MYYIGVDLGGTNIAVGLLDESFKIIAKEKCPTKTERDISEIMDDMERGVTGIYSYGCYKEKDQMMLMCIVRSREVPVVMDIVKKYDPAAFTIISDVKEVRGEGFKEVENV